MSRPSGDRPGGGDGGDGVGDADANARPARSTEESSTGWVDADAEPSGTADADSERRTDAGAVEGGVASAGDGLPGGSGPVAADDPPDGRLAEPSSPAAMAARIEALEAETRRLRAESRRAKRTRYRRTAAGLAGVGVVAALAGVLFPDASDVLFALAGTGLFAAVLTRYLTPERFVAADVGERVYAPLAANYEGLAASLGLSDERVYVPRDGDPRLFVPQFDRYDLPGDDALAETLVVPAGERARGLSLEPTGGALFDEFERTRSGPLATAPRSLCDQLTAAIVESFELADGTEVDVDPAGGRASIAVYGSAYGPGDRFDDPLVSLLAVGLAVGLDRPVRATVDRVEDADGAGFVATFRWETGEGDDGTDDDAERGDGTDDPTDDPTDVDAADEAVTGDAGTADDAHRTNGASTPSDREA